VKVAIEISAGDVQNLRALATSEAVGGKKIEDVLHYLLERIADGVGRRGSWEREWLRCAFSDDWEASLEDVDEWRQRPREGALLKGDS
jgi:hypothetical protein